MYAPAAENLEYIQRVTRENDFYKYMKFQHEILKASWTDEDAMWELSIKDLKSGSTFEDKVHVFLELNGPVRYVIRLRSLMECVVDNSLAILD
jgi:hypothetical protein